MKFRCSTTGSDPLGLVTMVEQFANGQWIADHYTPDQATAFMLDRFKRRIAAELEMIELTVRLGKAFGGPAVSVVPA